MMTYLKVFFLVSLIVVSVVTPVIIVYGSSFTTPVSDPFIEDMTNLNTRYSSLWEYMRQEAHDEEELIKLRKEWRESYNIEVEKVYKHHGKTYP